MAREAEVLDWIAHGKSNQKAAIILEAAFNNIKRHVQNVLVKPDVKSRLVAAPQASEILGTRDFDEQKTTSGSTRSS